MADIIVVGHITADGDAESLIWREIRTSGLKGDLRKRIQREDGIED